MHCHCRYFLLQKLRSQPNWSPIQDQYRTISNGAYASWHAFFQYHALCLASLVQHKYTEAYDASRAALGSFSTVLNVISLPYMHRMLIVCPHSLRCHKDRLDIAYDTDSCMVLCMLLCAFAASYIATCKIYRLPDLSNTVSLQIHTPCTKSAHAVMAYPECTDLPWLACITPVDLNSYSIMAVTFAAYTCDACS